MESIELRPAQKEHLGNLIQSRNRIQDEINRFLAFTIKDLEVPNDYRFAGLDEGWVLDIEQESDKIDSVIKEAEDGQ